MTQEEKQKYLDAYDSPDKVVVIAYGHGWEPVLTRKELEDMLEHSHGFSFKIACLEAYPTMADFVKAQKHHGPYLRFNSFQGRLKLPIEVDEVGAYFKGIDGFEYYTYIELKKKCKWQDGTYCGIIKYFVEL